MPSLPSRKKIVNNSRKVCKYRNDSFKFSCPAQFCSIYLFCLKYFESPPFLLAGMEFGILPSGHRKFPSVMGREGDKGVGREGDKGGGGGVIRTGEGMLPRQAWVKLSRFNFSTSNCNK